MSHRGPIALSLLVLLSAAPLSAQQVHVVDDDGGPGVDFTTLSAAVAAASSGDVLLIESGSYAGAFTLDGKALVLAADADATVDLQAGVATVQNLAAGQTVTLRGVHSHFVSWNLVSDAGTVWFEDCSLEFDDALTLGTMTATGCANVVVTCCTISAAPAVSTFGDNVPSDGIHAQQSQLTLYECTVTGGSGDLSMTTIDVPGQQAVELVDATLFLAGSTLTGGPGATAAGGAALRVAGASTAWLLDDTLAGGDGTPDGAAVEETLGGVAIALPGPASRLELDSPKRMGEPVTLTLDGPPGQQAWLMKWLAPGGVVKPGWSGVLLVDPAHFSLLALGNIPGSGELSLTANVPTIAGLQALPLYLQGVALAPGSIRLTSGSHLLILAPGF